MRQIKIAAAAAAVSSSTTEVRGQAKSRETPSFRARYLSRERRKISCMHAGGDLLQLLLPPCASIRAFRDLEINLEINTWCLFADLLALCVRWRQR